MKKNSMLPVFRNLNVIGNKQYAFPWCVFFFLVFMYVPDNSHAQKEAKSCELYVMNADYQQISLHMDTSPIPYPNEISPELLMGKIDPENHPFFTEVCVSVSDKVGKYMHQEAYAAFMKMREAAAADGIHLIIVSAMRTFDEQKRIWNKKWTGRVMLADNIDAAAISDPFERALEILRFSAMPGTSRHHWGTDIDLNSVEPAYFETPQGQRVYQWLKNNACRFGFCQPYNPRGDGRWGGYEEEPWHWSFKPIAALYLQAFATTISYDRIKGFHGWETAWEIRIIRNFVLNVNRDCRLQIGD